MVRKEDAPYTKMAAVAEQSTQQQQPKQQKQPDEEEQKDPDVEECLTHTVLIFEGCKRLLDASDDDTVAVPRSELKRMRKAAASTNRALTRFVRGAYLREDRLNVEAAMVYQAARRDAIEQAASRAKLVERLRLWNERGGAASSSTATTTGAGVSLSGHAATTEIDKAITAVARVERAICSLSPTGHVGLHGAGFLAAQSRGHLDGLLKASDA